jgi:hypothetical protein
MSRLTAALLVVETNNRKGEMNIFDQSIETDDCGMAGGTSYYSIEEIYQAFKERLVTELVAHTDELLNNANLIDISED